MATLDWQLRRTGGVTLVELSVQADREQRVRLESRLTPVWPPRQQGVPVEGWDGDTYEGQVEEDRPLVVGYATPAPPAEPPAELTGTGRPTETDTVTSRTLVRTLGDARPPRDVLPDATPAENTGTPDESDTAAVTVGSGQEAEKSCSRTADTGRAATETPEGQAVTAWFNAVESRLATTRQLAGATDADEIREAVEAAGGIEAVRSLQAQLEADRRQLQAIHQRSETLGERLAAVELPLATLERVV